MVGFDAANVAISLDECKEEVERDAQHFLSFATRRRMLLRFGSPAAPLDALRLPMNEGHRVRAHLAWQVAERALPIWSAEHGGEPGDAIVPLQLMRAIVEGEGLDRKKLSREGMALANHLDGGAPPGDAGFAYVYAGYAIAYAALVFAKDELLTAGYGATQLDVESPEEHQSYDCAAWGAAAAAGDLPWGNPQAFDPSRARDYWLWYLGEAVPLAMGSGESG